MADQPSMSTESPVSTLIEQATPSLMRVVDVDDVARTRETLTLVVERTRERRISDDASQTLIYKFDDNAVADALEQQRELVYAVMSASRTLLLATAVGRSEATIINAFAEWPATWLVAWTRVAASLEALGADRLEAELRAVHVLDPGRCPWWAPPALEKHLRERSRRSPKVVELGRHRHRRRRR
jgi:hypothetical protein